MFALAALKYRVEFKIATLVYKCLHEVTPVYLARQCVPVSPVAGRHHLRSGVTNKLDIFHTHAVLADSCPFSVSSLVVWNSLLAELAN